LLIKVKHPSHIAISNTHVQKITQDNDGAWYQFDESPLMSTYLFIFVIGKFEFIETKSSNGVEIKVYAPTG